MEMGRRKDGFRILVVDDSKLALKHFQAILKPPRYIVEVANNGEVALAKAKAFNPDLIISDVVMPGLDGFGLCEAIKSDPMFTNTIFLLSSATLTEVKDAIRGLEGGADDYLPKPLDKEQTKAKIDAFLRIKSLQDDLLASNKELGKSVDALEKHERLLEESNKVLEEEKGRLKHYLKEISYLVEELEKSHHYHVALNETLKRNFDDMVTLLATIIEHRDPCYRGHSQKVAEISRYIADQFDLAESELRDVEIAALLHEIGKIGIADDIIKKSPLEYSEEERRVVAQHPLVGESLLKGYSGLEQVARTIRHVHENLDGSGYPDGLAGDQIPVGSRIIRVASRFDRLTSTLSDVSAIYRVVSSLAEQVDTQFDSQVVRHLRKYVDTFADRRKYGRTEKVDIVNLKEGMALSEDLYTSSGIKLMPAGTKLTKASIRCILNYNKTDPLDKGVSIYAR